MSGPRRWKDSADAPLGVQELLRSAKGTVPMGRPAFERGAARLAKTTAAPAAAGLLATIWAKAAAAGVVGLATVSVTLAVRHDAPALEQRVLLPEVTTAIVATAGSVARARTADPARTEAVPKAALPIATPAPRMVAAPEPARVAFAEPAPVAFAEPAPVRTASTLREELALLEAARSALSTGPTTALERLAEHRERFPRGTLAVERDLLELDALERVGRRAEARERARAWLARDPSSMHAARLADIASR